MEEKHWFMEDIGCLVAETQPNTILHYRVSTEDNSLEESLRKLTKDGGFIWKEYDPLWQPGDKVKVAELVICSSTLEHIKYDDLNELIDEAIELARFTALFILRLSSGRQPQWWLTMIKDRIGTNDSIEIMEPITTKYRNGNIMIRVKKG